jgi:hypothetical protein
MIDLAIVLSLLSLVLEIKVGASGYVVDGFEGQTICVLLGGFCGLWRWWKCTRFWFWLDYLGILCRIGYLKWRQRVGDGRPSGMSLAHVWGIVIWLVVWRRVSVIIGLVFRVSVVVSVQRLD